MSKCCKKVAILQQKTYNFNVKHDTFVIFAVVQ